jgi:hypothetical protein
VKEDILAAKQEIYEVALSLDSFLIDGILYGVLPQAAFPGFLEKIAGNLLRDVASLEEQTPHAPHANQSKVGQVLATLRGKCQQLIDVVRGLSSFRTLPLEQLRATVAQIPPLREACVQHIQELEACFQIPKPFYPSRPPHARAAVDDFLANLEHLFTQEWSAFSA